MIAFFSVGPLEIAVLAVIALLVLGPQKLPEAARSVGQGHAGDARGAVGRGR